MSNGERLMPHMLSLALLVIGLASRRRIGRSMVAASVPSVGLREGMLGLVEQHVLMHSSNRSILELLCFSPRRFALRALTWFSRVGGCHLPRVCNNTYAFWLCLLGFALICFALLALL